MKLTKKDEIKIVAYINLAKIRISNRVSGGIRDMLYRELDHAYIDLERLAEPEAEPKKEESKDGDANKQS